MSERMDRFEKDGLIGCLNNTVSKVFYRRSLAIIFVALVGLFIFNIQAERWAEAVKMIVWAALGYFLDDFINFIKYQWNFITTSKRYDADFEKWAFGFVPLCYDLHLMNIWNDRHADLLVIKATDSVNESIDAMLKLYRIHRILHK